MSHDSYRMRRLSIFCRTIFGFGVLITIAVVVWSITCGDVQAAKIASGQTTDVTVKHVFSVHGELKVQARSPASAPVAPVYRVPERPMGAIKNTKALTDKMLRHNSLGLHQSSVSGFAYGRTAASGGGLHWKCCLVSRTPQLWTCDLKPLGSCGLSMGPASVLGLDQVLYQTLLWSRRFTCSLTCTRNKGVIAMRNQFGVSLMELRKARGFTSRGFAIAVELDPAYYGRIERGEVAPPGEVVLARFAEKLGIVVGVSSEWFEFLYNATVARGRIPDAVQEQEPVALLLPAFFARLRGQQIASTSELFRVLQQIAAERTTPPGEDVENVSVVDTAAAK